MFDSMEDLYAHMELSNKHIKKRKRMKRDDRPNKIQTYKIKKKNVRHKATFKRFGNVIRKRLGISNKSQLIVNAY